MCMISHILKVSIRTTKGVHVYMTSKFWVYTSSCDWWKPPTKTYIYSIFILIYRIILLWYSYGVFTPIWSEGLWFSRPAIVIIHIFREWELGWSTVVYSSHGRGNILQQYYKSIIKELLHCCYRQTYIVLKIVA